MQCEIPFVLYLKGILIKHRHINMIIWLQFDATYVKMVAGGWCQGNFDEFVNCISLFFLKVLTATVEYSTSSWAKKHAYGGYRADKWPP